MFFAIQNQCINAGMQFCALRKPCKNEWLSRGALRRQCKNAVFLLRAFQIYVNNALCESDLFRNHVKMQGFLSGAHFIIKTMVLDTKTRILEAPKLRRQPFGSDFRPKADFSNPFSVFFLQNDHFGPLGDLHGVILGAKSDPKEPK